MSIIVPDPLLTDWVPMSYGASIQTNVPCARVVRGAGQSVASSTIGWIAHDAKVFDTDNMWAIGSPTRLTCRTAGKYLIGAHVDFSTNSTGTFREALIQINGLSGSRPIDVLVPQSITTGYGRQEPVGLVDLIVGDYIELGVYHDATSAISFAGAILWATYIGPGLLGRGQQNISGTYLLRPAANTVPAGSTYFATDTFGTWLSDGLVWTLVNQRAPIITASGMTVAPFTTPYDGQEIILTDSLTTPLYNWRLRYNSSDSSVYKWEFVGGAPHTGYSAAGVQMTSTNTWFNIVASTIIVPRTGEYVCQATLQITHPTAGTTCYAIMWMGSLPGGVFGPAPATGYPVAGGYAADIPIGPFKVVLTGGNGVGVAAQNNQINGTASYVSWSMIPVRL